MLKAENSGPILIATGMHRSGTSMLASLLSDAGVDLGSRFKPADVANARGYYENVDFIELHYQFFQYHGLSKHGWSLTGQLTVPAELEKKARQTVEANRRPHPWGWKDPRTMFFLDFWADLLPEAKFLFIYRAPWEVIDSLFRRGDDVFQEAPSLAVRVGEHYTRLLLEFCRRYPERCLLVGLETVQREPAALIQAIREKFSIPLSHSGRDLFDEKLLTQQPSSSSQAMLVRMCFPDLFSLWQDLRQASNIAAGNLPQEAGCGPTLDAVGELMLKCWMETRLAQLERKEAEHTVDRMLSETRSDLYHARQKLEYI